ncbi:MAG: endolytic transglycosylase MltG [Gammaproteobacteria bacterium]|nr:endolytic transglycosylase MltG [Gammaproteobacteria bacterium]
MLRILSKWVLTITVCSVLFFITTFILLFMDYQRFLKTPVVISTSPETFTVRAGDTISSLVKEFENKGLPLATESPFSQVLGKYYFKYLAKSTKKANRLKIGEYQLLKGMTAPEVLDTLISGRTIAHKVRFLEGWNFKAIRKTLEKNPNIAPTLLFVPDDEILAALGLGDGKTSYEGQFFPDTYQFPNHSKDGDVLKQAYRLMQKKLQAAWDARDTSIKLKSPYELLILASIIEKETSLDSERKQISGVFHRRLAQGMPLQTDPTVIYGMGAQYKGTIYRSDLKRDTPYNTYTRKGLPPTPIASPGLASLMAAGQPDKGNSLYFVADGTGGHKFSATYKEHLAAVKAYRKMLKQQKNRQGNK